MEYDDYWGPATLIVSTLTILPTLRVSVRRLHDVDKSGWWILIVFTFIGFILLIHWATKESNIGGNQFGSDPLEKINEERIAKPISKFVHFSVIFIAIVFTFLKEHEDKEAKFKLSSVSRGADEKCYFTHYERTLPVSNLEFIGGVLGEEN